MLSEMTERERRTFEANRDWWNDRMLRTQEKLSKKTIAETEAQLRKYYQQSQRATIGRFLSTYNKVLLSIERGREPTPADLYKLDTYWQMQGQLKQELQAMGDKQAALLSDKFTQMWIDAYNSFAITDDTNFNLIDRKTAQQMINQIWCDDGKTWSQRIWTNTDKLQQALNDGLTECVLTGAAPKDLRQRLMYEFNVSYNNADMLVRTEITHIQTQATKQRYEDSGIKEVYVWADEDERRCDICGKLHEQRFSIYDKMPVPAHPRCRCRILPVIE